MSAQVTGEDAPCVSLFGHYGEHISNGVVCSRCGAETPGGAP